MKALRPLIALLLSLCLAWASASQAVAHAEMQGASEVTLCDASGQGQTVTLDATGKPVSRHACQDCLAAQAQAILARPAAPAPRLATTRPADFATQPFPALAPLALHKAQPRAPPALV